MVVRGVGGPRGRARNRRTDSERGGYMTPSPSNNGSSCGAQLSRRAAGIRNVECGISGLGSDSYCLCVIFRVHTGSLLARHVTHERRRLLTSPCALVCVRIEEGGVKIRNQQGKCAMMSVLFSFFSLECDNIIEVCAGDCDW